MNEARGPSPPGPSRPSLVRNLVANSAAQFWSAALSVLFVPVFVHALGIEGYGFVAWLATVQAIVRGLDLGLFMAVNRQMSILEARGDATAKASFFRTFEV